MFKHFIPSVEFWDNEQVAEEDYAKINLSKLNLIEHGNYKYRREYLKRNVKDQVTSYE